jgi:hypothetical protein
LRRFSLSGAAATQLAGLFQSGSDRGFILDAVDPWQTVFHGMRTSYEWTMSIQLIRGLKGLCRILRHHRGGRKKS